MKRITDSFRALMGDNRGASNVEIIVWISVVLVIATVLFLFRDAITNFIGNAIGRIDGFQF